MLTASVNVSMRDLSSSRNVFIQVIRGQAGCFFHWDCS